MKKSHHPHIVKAFEKVGGSKTIPPLSRADEEWIKYVRKHVGIFVRGLDEAHRLAKNSKLVFKSSLRSVA